MWMSRCPAAQVDLSAGRSSCRKNVWRKVYRMQDGQCVSCMAADVPPQKMQMVVLALNNVGIAVAAIYLIP